MVTKGVVYVVTRSCSLCKEVFEGVRSTVEKASFVDGGEHGGSAVVISEGFLCQ